MSRFANPAGSDKNAISAYVQALLDILANRDPLSVMRELRSSLATLADGLSDADLRKSESPGKWSVIEVVQHLADSELVFGYRLRMVLAHDKPPIQAYDQDLWASRLHYSEANLHDALEQIRLLRRVHLRLLDSLSPEELERSGIHEERGGESVRRMLQLYAGHDLVHRRQIERIRKTIGA